MKREINLIFENPPVAIPSPVKEFPEIEVELPAQFASLRTSDQFLYLKNQFQLTNEQANDVLAAVSGQTPVHSKVTVTEQSAFATETAVVSTPVPPINVRLSHDFASQKRVYQEMALTRDYGLSLADAQDVLRALKNEPVSRAVHLTIDPAPVVEPDLVESVPEFEVELPAQFSTLRTSDQFMYLTTQSHLTRDQANDVLAVLSGAKPSFSKVTIKEA